MPAPDWTVLVILGASGSGKSNLARQIGLQSGIPWLQADDLRLAFSASGVGVREGNATSFYFDRVPSEGWPVHEPDLLRDRMIEVADVMRDGIHMIIMNHLALGDRLVLEGDCIHPDLASEEDFLPYVERGDLIFWCLGSNSEEDIRTSIHRRGRGRDDLSSQRVFRLAQFHHLYAEWLEQRSELNGIPILPSRPFPTLHERFLTRQSL